MGEKDVREKAEEIRKEIDEEALEQVAGGYIFDDDRGQTGPRTPSAESWKLC